MKCLAPSRAVCRRVENPCGSAAVLCLAVVSPTRASNPDGPWANRPDVGQDVPLGMVALVEAENFGPDRTAHVLSRFPGDNVFQRLPTPVGEDSSRNSRISSGRI